MVWMNGERWPRDGRTVSLTRVLAALRKALVRNVWRAGAGGG